MGLVILIILMYLLSSDNKKEGSTDVISVLHLPVIDLNVALSMGMSSPIPLSSIQIPSVTHDVSLSVSETHAFASSEVVNNDITLGVELGVFDPVQTSRTDVSAATVSLAGSLTVDSEIIFLEVVS